MMSILSIPSLRTIYIILNHFLVKISILSRVYVILITTEIL